MRDRESTFLRPLWRRVALVAFCAAWAVWEWWNAEMFWAMLVGAITVYGAWTFLFDYDRRPVERSSDDSEQP